MDDLRRGRHAEGVDAHFLSAHHLGKREEIARLAAGAGADVGTVELHVGHLAGELALARIGVTRHGRLECAQVDRRVVNERLVVVALDRLVVALCAVELGSLIDHRAGFVVVLKNAVLAAGFDRHVGHGHAVVHRQAGRAGAVELHRAISRPVEADLADCVQDDVLGHDARLQFALEAEMHRLRHLDQQFAGAHHEAGVGVANAGGKLVERAGHAGVRVGAEQNLAGPKVPLLRQSRVADAGVARAVLALEQALRGVELPLAVLVIDHVVEILKPLRLGELAQDVHVAVGQRVGGENVVVGNDHDLVGVPNPGVLAELALEHPDRAGATDVMRHQQVGVHPDIVTGVHLGLARRPGQNFLSQRHRRRDNVPANRSSRKEEVGGANSTLPHLKPDLGRGGTRPSLPLRVATGDDVGGF